MHLKDHLKSIEAANDLSLNQKTFSRKLSHRGYAMTIKTFWNAINQVRKDPKILIPTLIARFYAFKGNMLH